MRLSPWNPPSPESEFPGAHPGAHGFSGRPKFGERTKFPGHHPSQTGTSATTVQAVEHARRLGMRVITVTAEKESPIARVSPEMLVIPVGPETVGPKTKGYMASVLALLLLVLGPPEREIRIPGLFGRTLRFDRPLQNGLRRDGQDFSGNGFRDGYGPGAALCHGARGIPQDHRDERDPCGRLRNRGGFSRPFPRTQRKKPGAVRNATPDQQEMAAGGAEVLSRLGIGVHILNLGRSPSSPSTVTCPGRRTTCCPNWTYWAPSSVPVPGLAPGEGERDRPGKNEIPRSFAKARNQDASQGIKAIWDADERR